MDEDITAVEMLLMAVWLWFCWWLLFCYVLIVVTTW